MAQRTSLQPLTFIAYLSGKRKSEQWHAERDSVAGEVTLRGEAAATFRDLMRGCFDDDLKDGLMPWWPASTLADVASDMELPALEALAQTGMVCGYIHIRGL